MIVELSQLEDLLKEAQQSQRQGNLVNARQSYERILFAQPNNVGVLTQLAILNLQLNDLQAAKLKVESALALSPQSVNLLNIAAVIYQNSAEVDKALNCYSVASNLDPNNASVKNNLGQLHLNLGNLSAAEKELSKATQLSPQLPEAWSNLGSVHKAKGDFNKAIECQQQAIQLKPNFADAHYNLGNALKEIGEYQKAEETYKTCLTIASQHKGALSGLGLIRLVQGDYVNGLPLFEHRLDTNTQKKSPQPTLLIKWQGEEIPNGKLLVTHEQGLGDQIHCARFAPVLRDRGFQVYWQTPAVLKSLFKSNNQMSDIQWIDENQIPTDVTHYTPIMSLFGNLNIDPANHHCGPYLTTSLKNDDESIETSSDLNQRTSFKVGLCWQGNPNNPTDYKRSIAWSELSQLLKVDGVEFVSLQKDIESNTNLTAKYSNFSQTEIENATDFYNTAQLISKLDLVISVDTAVLHLAGAMGVPCWGLLAYINDWRWALETPNTPWYEQMVLYRQNSTRQWGSVISEVTADLKKKLV